MITKEQMVKQMKREIVFDMTEWRMPCDVTSFSQMHDHLDANCYGSLCNDLVLDTLINQFGGPDDHGGMPEAMANFINFSNFINQCQDEIDAWLKNHGQFEYKSVRRALAERALNLACRHVQDAIGVTDGGVAGIFFSDDRVSKTLQEYVEHELSLMGGRP